MQGLYSKVPELCALLIALWGEEENMAGMGPVALPEEGPIGVRLNRLPEVK